jgi:membrane-associated phospholipid phosphatase
MPIFPAKPSFNLKSVAGSALYLSAALLLASHTAGAAPALGAASSAELQALLATQESKLAVHFSNHKPPSMPTNTYDRLMMWNEVALDTTAIDHTPVSQGENRVFGEQFGPHRTSRALAIVQIGVFEAVNAYYQTYKSYAGVSPVSGDVSVDYAIAQAAHDTLSWLYPSQKPRLDDIFDLDVVTIGGTQAGRQAGAALGMAAAQAIIALRTNDGSQYTEPQVGVNFTPIGGIGHWQIDPVDPVTTALGAYWGQVKPFVLSTGAQFRPAPPPALTSQEYTKAFKDVAAIGGDPLHGTPSTRNNRQTFMGIYWTYDGTPGICAPARLYNQIARTLAFQTGLNTVPDAARFLAVTNTSLADAGISAWDAKWFYQFWRPVTGIRQADQTGNPKTPANPNWYPLGGQATNTSGPNFTPPFPSYPSGHATFGGALFEVFRHYWPDATPFTFVSDEFNGKNLNIYGQVQPRHPVTYQSFTDAEYDNAESRIFIGVHWQFDADTGIAEGRQVADYVLANAFQPVTPPRR